MISIARPTNSSTTIYLNRSAKGNHFLNAMIITNMFGARAVINVNDRAMNKI